MLIKVPNKKASSPFLIFYCQCIVKSYGTKLRRPNMVKLYLIWTKLSESVKKQYYDLYLKQFVSPFRLREYDPRWTVSRKGMRTLVRRDQYVDWIKQYMTNKATKEDLYKTTYELAVELGKIWNGLEKK